MATLHEKFATLHAAEEAAKKAYADLADPATGEVVGPDAPVYDEATGRMYWIASGKLQSKKATVIPAK